MDFDNRKVYGDTSITDGLVFPDLDLFNEDFDFIWFSTYFTCRF